MPPKSSAKTDAAPTESLNITAIQSKLAKRFPRVTTGTNIAPTKFLPTGHVGLDYVLGGGVPVGKLIELVGATHVGKSSCALYLAAAVQRNTGRTIYICDSEDSIDEGYLLRLGLDPTNVITYRTTSLNNALAYYREVVGTPAYNCGCFIFDTVAGFTPDAYQERLEEDAGAANMAIAARMWGQNRSVLSELATVAESTTIFVNHMSTVLSPYGGGNPRSGGKAIPALVSLTLIFRGGGKKLADDLKGLPDYKGVSVDVEVEKSRFGTLGLRTTLDLTDTGYDPTSSLCRLAKLFKVAQSSGAWIDLDVGAGQTERINGLSKLYQYLIAHPDTAEYVRTRVLAVANQTKGVEPDPVED